MSEITLPSKADVVKHVASRISLNQYGLPEGFYRVDLLPYDASIMRPKLKFTAAPQDTGLLLPGANVDPQQREMHTDIETPPYEGVTDIFAPDAPQPSRSVTVIDQDPNDLEIHIDPQLLQAAYVPLSYVEGFPTTPEGIPFWEKLDFEPFDAYTAFHLYVQQGKKGARQLYELAKSPELRQILCNNGENSNQIMQLLQQWYVIYYWGARTRAFDIFSIAHHRKSREMLAMELENEHLQQANKLWNMICIYTNSDVFWKNVNPKVVIELMKQVTQMQRISLGLPGTAPRAEKSGNDGAPMQSLEVIMRQLTTGINLDDTRQTSLTESVRNTLLENPELASHAQELIIRLTQGQTFSDH